MEGKRTLDLTCEDPTPTVCVTRYNDLLLSALENRGYKKMFLWSDDVQDGNGMCRLIHPYLFAE
jgi:hypothetical protein